MTPEEFLADHPSRRGLTLVVAGISPVAAFDGRGAHPLEVALATSASRPRAEDMRRAWKSRHGGAPSPLLLVVAYETDGAWKASICGPVGDEPPVEADLDLGLVERIAAAALDQPSRHQAIRFLGGILAEVESELPGIRNHGMLATHELRDGVPQRQRLGRRVRARAPAPRLERPRPRREARLPRRAPLDSHDSFSASATLDVLSPCSSTRPRSSRHPPPGSATRARSSHALAYADRAELPWVVVTRGTQIRLYSAKPDVGVGRKGRADTYVEANLALVPDDRAGYLTLLFSADALKTDGTLTEILETSRDYAAALGARLRDRVYEEAVPNLALALAGSHGDRARRGTRSRRSTSRPSPSSFDCCSSRTPRTRISSRTGRTAPTVTTH